MDSAPGRMMAETGWADQLEHLYRVAIAVSDAHDVDSALQLIVDSAREIAGAEMGALGIPGQPGQPMAHFYTSGLPAERKLPIGHPPLGRGVLGLLLEGGQSLRLADVQAHPAFTGYPDAHPGVRSFLGVPIHSRGRTLGDLYLANKRDACEFSETDQRLVEMLAGHAAVVIEGLQYHRQAHRIALLQQREALAAQLQDDVLQTMYGAGLLLHTLNLRDPEQAATDLQNVRALLDTAIERLRQHLTGLTRTDG